MLSGCHRPLCQSYSTRVRRISARLHPSLVGPFLVWLFKRDEPYVDEQAKEALNFNISFLIYGVASALLIILLIGLLLLPAVFVTWFVLVIVAAVKASAGEHYRYPLTIRFIR